MTPTVVLCLSENREPSRAHSKLIHQLSCKICPSLSEFQSHRVDLIFLANPAIVSYPCEFLFLPGLWPAWSREKVERGATHSSHATTVPTSERSQELSEFKMGWFNIVTTMRKATALWTLPPQSPTSPPVASQLLLLWEMKDSCSGRKQSQHVGPTWQVGPGNHANSR